MFRLLTAAGLQLAGGVVITLIVAGALQAAGGSEGGTSSPSMQQLSREIAALRDEIERLRRGREADWVTTQRTDEIRRLVGEVLADADVRTSLLEAPAAVGWDRGFVVGSPDGDYLLRVNAQLQFRFAYNRQEGGAVDHDRWGFTNRRAKIGISGHVLDPSWRYKVRGSFGSALGVFRTSDVYVEKRLGDGWSLRAGQFKPPFIREELVSSSRQLAAERSLVNEAFNQGRSDGIELAFQAERFAARVMLNDGFNRDDLPALVTDSEFAVTARAELLLTGSWGQFKDYASWGGEEDGLLLGGAVHYEQGDERILTSDEENILAWTFDAAVEHGGMGLSVAAVGRHLDVAGADRFGVVAQGGVFLVPDVWDLFVRYEWGDPDTGGPDLQVITAGVNRYVRGHDLKLTLDVGYGLNPVGLYWASLGAGWRPDEPGRDGQIVVRTQFQLVF